MESAPECVACRGPMRFFGPKDDYTYYRCVKCGSIQLFPMPGEEELERAYSRDYSTSGHSSALEDPERWESAGRGYHESVLAALGRYPVSGPVLDYGAGWGTLCEKLIQKGYLCRGLEISEDMLRFGLAKGLPLGRSAEDLLAGLDGKKFQAVVLCGVFEHLIRHDQWFQRIRGLLEDGGYLITMHPTAKLFGILGQALRLGNVRAALPTLHTTFCPPWHTVLFSVEGTNLLAFRNGFRLLEIRPAAQGRSGGWTTALQICLEGVNRIGWKLCGVAWPLLTSHVFIYEKTRIP